MKAEYFTFLIFCYLSAVVDSHVVDVTEETPCLAPCQVGNRISSFSRRAYLLATRRLTQHRVIPTYLTICRSIMVIPCSGTLRSWRVFLVRQANVNETFLGVWRRESPISDRYLLVGSTALRDPNDPKASFVFPGYLQIHLSKRERFFVEKGDLLGVHYADGVSQPTVAYLDEVDSLGAGLAPSDCSVLSNVPAKSINRDIEWTKSVTLYEEDFIVSQRTYALYAEIEEPEVGERCGNDHNCPQNAKCYSLSCTEQFCICKPGFLPSYDAKTCRQVVDSGERCQPAQTACKGELDAPEAAAKCSGLSNRCECQPNFASRAPFNFKCRPRYEAIDNLIIGNRTLQLALSAFSTTYGLLGDDCSSEAHHDSVKSDESDMISLPFAPCLRSSNLECVNNKCVCRIGYRPKTALERAVYVNSLDECILSSETIGCHPVRTRPTPSTTTPKPTTPTTSKPKCYSTYTCWLLEMKNQSTTTEESWPANYTDVSIVTSTTSEVTVTQKPKIRIGERCLAENNCPLNARCYPFTCENFICTCRIGYTPSSDYRKCLPEIGLGERCIPTNSSLGICRGSQLLAGSLSICDRRICICTPPYSSIPNKSLRDRPGFCRMTMENETNVFGRLNDVCNENRTCYPPAMTQCVNGRCACAPGYREKLPLEYGYLPDRSSQCISLDFQIGCGFITKTNPVPTTTTTTTTMAPNITVEEKENSTIISEPAATTPIPPLPTSTKKIAVKKVATRRKQPTTTRKPRPKPPLKPRPKPVKVATMQGTPAKETQSTTTPQYSKPVTITSLRLSVGDSGHVWIPLVIGVVIVAIVSGVFVYICVFQPECFERKKKLPTRSSRQNDNREMNHRPRPFAMPVEMDMEDSSHRHHRGHGRHHRSNHHHHHHQGQHRHHRNNRT